MQLLISSKVFYNPVLRILKGKIHSSNKTETLTKNMNNVYIRAIVILNQIST